MKPGRRDIRHKVLITGDELRELKRHTGSMAEAFGLDRKIEAYKGTRPITLYRWDLECLMDVIECELGDPREYPDNTASEYLALKTPGGSTAHGVRPALRRQVIPSISKVKEIPAVDPKKLREVPLDHERGLLRSGSCSPSTVS